MPGKTFTLFVVSGENKNTTLKIDEDATVKELRKKVADAIDGVEEDDVRIHYAGKDLRSEGPSGQKLTLKDFNLRNEATLFVVMCLPGGSDDPPSVVEPKMYGPDVQLTDKPDMFTLDDEAGGQRAEMPCGHAISPESLTAYCRSLLSSGKYEFLCPYKAKPGDPYCGASWELCTVTRLAVLTADEVKEFKEKMEENYPRKHSCIQSCSLCKGFCDHKEDRCEFTGEFIKNCGDVWCTCEDSRLSVLRSCSKTFLIGVLCPTIRACPSCGILTTHNEQRKLMVCRCGQKFCFICLKKADENGRYQCGVYNFKCEPAPVQTSIPGC